MPYLSLLALLSLAACVEKAVPYRKDEDRWGKLFWLAFFVGLIVVLWLEVEWLRVALLLVPPVSVLFRIFRSRGRLDLLRRVTLRVGLPLTALLTGLLLMAFASPFPELTRIEQSRVSPDGKWEVRIVEHGGFAYCVDELVLIPRGLATLSPLAYPSRSMGEMTIEGDCIAMKWERPDALVLYLRPQSSIPPYLQSNAQVSVRAVNVSAPPASRPDLK